MTTSIKSIKKRSRQGAIISSIGLLVAIIAFALSIINQERTKRQLEKNIQQNQELIDSTFNLKLIVDSTIIQKQQNEKIRGVIEDYIKYSNSHQADNLSTLLSDTLNRFFLKSNIAKNKVIEGLKWYWKNYPNATYTYDLNTLIISEYDSINYQIILKGFYARDGYNKMEVLSYIRLNTENKIYFTREYLPE